MGAMTFKMVVVGRTAQEAFDAAVAKAQYDHGHSGYTGTIAEKDSFIVLEVPDGEDPFEFAQNLMDADDERISRKWGPAGCIELPQENEAKQREFFFFGWASY